MKIVFPHIPKCAGSSIQKQLKARNDVYLDYFNNPLCSYEPDREAGRREQEKFKEKLSTLDAWIVFGHFACAAYNDIPYDLQIVLLRDPLDRAVSNYFHTKEVLPNNEIHRTRYAEVAPIKDGRMSIEEYVQLDYVRHFYGDNYLKDLVLDERLVVFPVEQMNTSFKEIARISGIRLDSSVWVNKGTHSMTYEHLRCHFERDAELYQRLIERTATEPCRSKRNGSLMSKMLRYLTSY